MVLIPVAKIVKRHGYSGKYRYKLLADVKLQQLATIIIFNHDKPIKLQGEQLTISPSIIAVANIDCNLINTTLYCESNQLHQLANDHYYGYTLLDKRVVNHHNQVLGVVSNIIETKSNWVLICSSNNNSTLMIPFVHNYIIHISTEQIQVYWLAEWS